jgi:hypothetical protein
MRQVSASASPRRTSGFVVSRGCGPAHLCCEQARFLAVHFGRYAARIEGPNRAVVNRAATLTWVAENRDPIGSGPPSAP